MKLAQTSRSFLNCRLFDGSMVDIYVVDGIVTDIGPVGTVAIPAECDSQDIAGWLLLPAMCEPHAHLDKALTAEIVPNPQGDLQGAIGAWNDAAQRGVFGLEEMTQRSQSALLRLIAHGTTVVRTHVNVGANDPQLKNLRAVLAARASLTNLVDVQVVALMQSPLAGSDGAGNRAMLARAISAGVDLIGGCPHLEGDAAKMIRIAMDAALEVGVGMDLHTDETLDQNVLTLRDLARSVIERGFPHSVTASHCVSLSMQDESLQHSIADEVYAAGISIVALPQTNLFLQGRECTQAMPRGITPISLLRDHGVVVGAGGDNVQDPFNPVGRSDPLETAALLIMAAHQLPNVAYELVSSEVRKILGVATAGPQLGGVADFVAIDACSIRQAISDAPSARQVFRHGKKIAVTMSTQTFTEPFSEIVL